MYKSQEILNDIERYWNYSFKDDVSDRLSKTLSNYIRELDIASDRILSKKRRDIVTKELYK